MVEDKLKRFIHSACYGDMLRFQSNKNYDSIDINYGELETGQWSYIVETMIITIKSLLPSNEDISVVIDYKRFNEELKLWKDYRHGSNDALINTILTKDNSKYWINNDDSIYSRIVPLVVVNKDFSIIKEQVIKNVLYTTGNITILLEAIILSKLLFMLMNNENFEEEKIFKELKYEVIMISQKELLEQYKFLKIDRDTYPGNYVLDFERKRIDLLNTLHGIVKENDFHILRSSLEIVKNNILDFNDIEYDFFLFGIVGLLNNKVQGFNFKDKAFIDSLCNYIMKLRKSRISPEALHISDYSQPDILKFKEGKEFNHPLLNRCKIIKKIENTNSVVCFVRTKTGVYRFIKRKQPRF